MFEDQLLLIIGLKNHGILVERANAPSQFHPAKEVNSYNRFVFAGCIQKRVLDILCWLALHGSSPAICKKQHIPTFRGPNTKSGLCLNLPAIHPIDGWHRLEQTKAKLR